MADRAHGGGTGPGRLPIESATRVQRALRHVSVSVVPADSIVRWHRSISTTRAADGVACRAAAPAVLAADCTFSSAAGIGVTSKIGTGADSAETRAGEALR